MNVVTCVTLFHLLEANIYVFVLLDLYVYCQSTSGLVKQKMSCSLKYSSKSLWVHQWLPKVFLKKETIISLPPGVMQESFCLHDHIHFPFLQLNYVICLLKILHFSSLKSTLSSAYFGY